MKGKHNGSLNWKNMHIKGKKIQIVKMTTHEYMLKACFNSAILLIFEILVTMKNLSWVPTLVALQKIV